MYAGPSVITARSPCTGDAGRFANKSAICLIRPATKLAVVLSICKLPCTVTNSVSKSILSSELGPFAGLAVEIVVVIARLPKPSFACTVEVSPPAYANV